VNTWDVRSVPLAGVADADAPSMQLVSSVGCGSSGEPTADTLQLKSVVFPDALTKPPSPVETVAGLTPSSTTPIEINGEAFATDAVNSTAPIAMQCLQACHVSRCIALCCVRSVELVSERPTARELPLAASATLPRCKTSPAV
jgi:hypothetical protein